MSNRYWYLTYSNIAIVLFNGELARAEGARWQILPTLRVESL